MTPMQFMVREVTKAAPRAEVVLGRISCLSPETVYAWLLKHGPATTRQIYTGLKASKSVTNARLRDLGDRIESHWTPAGTCIRSVRK